MSQNFINEKLNIASGNGLVSAPNKPIPKPKLTQISN